MEAALAGRFVTNGLSAAGDVLRGLGTVLAPFEGAITALAVVWIGDKTWDGLQDAASNVGSGMKEDAEQDLAESGFPNMMAFQAWLTATYSDGGWDAICDSTFLNYRLTDSTELRYVPFLGRDAPHWFINRCAAFLRAICANRSEHEQFGVTPMELWSQHYNAEQYGKDAYYWQQKIARKAAPNWLLDLIGWA